MFIITEDINEDFEELTSAQQTARVKKIKQEKLKERLAQM
jgi:hypothetical protein